MRVGILCDNRRFANPEEPFASLKAGLEALGHGVQVLAPGADCRLGGFSELPEALFLWNGRKGPWGQVAADARRRGLRVIVMERGFFDRYRFTQLDPEGFSHTASWARQEVLRAPAPPEGQARFVGSYGRLPRPLRPRRDGYLLLLLQVACDSQLDGCELHHPLPLVQAVQDTAPCDLDIRVRVHPRSSWRFGWAGRARVIDGSLQDALAGARFAVTINSNSGNEALAVGCPLLALGPASYTIARVARRCSLADLPRALASMADGDLGPSEDQAPAIVRNYLFHLACRQFSTKELADPALLAGWLTPHCLRAGR